MSDPRTDLDRAMARLSHVIGRPRRIRPRPGTYVVHVRTPDDPGRWTAWGEQPVGRDYTYISGDVAVFVEFHEDELGEPAPTPEPDPEVGK